MIDCLFVVGGDVGVVGVGVVGVVVMVVLRSNKRSVRDQAVLVCCRDPVSSLSA